MRFLKILVLVSGEEADKEAIELATLQAETTEIVSSRFRGSSALLNLPVQMTT